MPSAIRAMRPPPIAPLRTMPIGAGYSTCWRTTSASSGARKARRRRTASMSHCLVRSMAADVIARSPRSVVSGRSALRAGRRAVGGVGGVAGRGAVGGVGAAAVGADGGQAGSGAVGLPGLHKGKDHLAHLLGGVVGSERLVEAQRLPRRRAGHDVERPQQPPRSDRFGGRDLGGEAGLDLGPQGLAPRGEGVLERGRERLLQLSGAANAVAQFVETVAAGGERGGAGGGGALRGGGGGR